MTTYRIPMVFAIWFRMVMQGIAFSLANLGKYE